MTSTVDQDAWAVVYPGDKFPEGAVRALGRGLDCKSEPHGCDAYVALWIRSDGEAVFGRAWNEDGKAKAVFPWGGKVVPGEETGGFRVLTYVGPCSKHGFKYRWVRAKKANEHDVLYVGEYSPAVAICNKGGESLGKGCWSRKMVWSCSGGNENCHQGDDFNDCFFLVKQKTQCDDDE